MSGALEPSGIRVRVMVEPTGADGLAFLIVDLREGTWVLRPSGKKQGHESLAWLVDQWIGIDNVWLRFEGETGLWGIVPSQHVLLLVWFLDALLNNVEYVAWLTLDPALDPAVPNRVDGAALRATLDALEPE